MNKKCCSVKEIKNKINIYILLYVQQLNMKPITVVNKCDSSNIAIAILNNVHNDCTIGSIDAILVIMN